MMGLGIGSKLYAKTDCLGWGLASPECCFAACGHYRKNMTVFGHKAFYHFSSLLVQDGCNAAVYHICQMDRLLCHEADTAKYLFMGQSRILWGFLSKAEGYFFVMIT